MKILLTGSNGQVGFELNKKLSALGEVIATDREELDLTNLNAIRTFIDHKKPDIFVLIKTFKENPSVVATKAFGIDRCIRIYGRL